MDVKELWEKHKKTITIGGICFLVLLLVLVVPGLLSSAQLGPVPDPTLATPTEVLTTLAKPAYRNQSDSFKLQYGTRVLDYYSRTPERIEQLAKAVNDMPETQAMELRENVIDMAKIQMVEDSKVFSTLRTESERKNFIDHRIKQMAGLQSMLTGRGSSVGGAPRTQGGYRGPNLATPKMTRGMPTDAHGLVKMFVDKTSPGERAKLETYVSKMQSRIEQIQSINRGRSGK